jgi:hypothetical protein
MLFFASTQNKKKNQDPFPIKDGFRDLEKLPEKGLDKKDSSEKEKCLNSVSEKLGTKPPSVDNITIEKKIYRTSKLFGGEKIVSYTCYKVPWTSDQFEDFISDGNGLLESLQNSAFQNFLLNEEKEDENRDFIAMLCSAIKKNEDSEFQKELSKFFVKNSVLAIKILSSENNEKEDEINWLGLEETLPKPFMARISQEILQNENGESGKGSENNKNNKVA